MKEIIATEEIYSPIGVKMGVRYHYADGSNQINTSNINENRPPVATLDKLKAMNALSVYYVRDMIFVGYLVPYDEKDLYKYNSLEELDSAGYELLEELDTIDELAELISHFKTSFFKGDISQLWIDNIQDWVLIEDFSEEEKRGFEEALETVKELKKNWSKKA